MYKITEFKRWNKGIENMKQIETKDHGNWKCEAVRCKRITEIENMKRLDVLMNIVARKYLKKVSKNEFSKCDHRRLGNIPQAAWLGARHLLPAEIVTVLSHWRGSEGKWMKKRRYWWKNMDSEHNRCCSQTMPILCDVMMYACATGMARWDSWMAGQAAGTKGRITTCAGRRV